MSDMESKQNETSSGGRARCYLKKHLTLKSGEPLYQILEKDKNGRIVKVSVQRRMKDHLEIWVRVAIHDKDILMEAETL